MTKERKPRSPHPQLDAFTRRVLDYRPSKEGGKSKNPKGRSQKRHQGAPDPGAGQHRRGGVGVHTVTAERHEKASRSRWLVDGAEVKTWMLSRRALEPCVLSGGGGVMDEQRLHGL